MRAVKPLKSKVLLLLLAIVCCEIVARAIVIDRDHVGFLFGRRTAFLVPFGVPNELPGIEYEPGSYNRYDPNLGWTIAETGEKAPLYFSDSRGLRCSKDKYEVVKSDSSGEIQNHFDVVCLGDSFTHGDEVLFEESWPSALSRMTGLGIANLGVGGYGIDQSALRYQKLGIKGEIVLLGLIAGDLDRATTPVYSFRTGGLKTKPMFSFQGSSVRVVNRPAIHGQSLRQEFSRGISSQFFAMDLGLDDVFFRRSVLNFSYIYRIVNTAIVRRRLFPDMVLLSDDERTECCLNILRYFRDSVEISPSKFCVVLLGNSNTFVLREGGEDPWCQFKRKLDRNGIDWIDTSGELFRLFEVDQSRVINSHGVHYTAEAHDMVAEMISEALTLDEATGLVSRSGDQSDPMCFAR